MIVARRRLRTVPAGELMLAAHYAARCAPLSGTVSLALRRETPTFAGRLNALALLVVMASNAGAQGAPAGPPTTDAERSRVFAGQIEWLRRAAHIPGLSVVVLRDTTVILAEGLGFADIDANRPVTPETPFNIASVAKPISAVVALRLVQDGRLDLDKPMRTFKGFAEFCDAARGDGGVFFADYACAGDTLTLRHVLSMTANGTPGTRFWYNPPSFSWASRPMAEVTGRSFSDLVDSLVFRPAGMKAARIHRALPLRAEFAANLAVPYHTDDAGQSVRSAPPPPQGDGAAGGVIASAMDLAQFDIALTNGRLLSPLVRAQLWQSPRASLPYGLGWFLGAAGSRRVAWHTGLWDGQYSALYLKVLSDVPTDRLTLILLANSDGLTWESKLNEAVLSRSPFAAAFFSTYPRSK